MEKPKLILVGGYLGAGKTSLLKAASKLLKAQNKTIGLITNDQTTGLVDTLVLRQDCGGVEEISGSCFCCNFHGFLNAANHLVDKYKCEVILAESVGSCTDLSATLMQPLKRDYSNFYELKPLSVLVDPKKLMMMVNDWGFTEEGTAYIFLKQLEEADYIVINKIDLLDSEDIIEIQKILNNKFLDHLVHFMSVREGQNIDTWLKKILMDTNAGRRIALLDYNKYALGEAAMGWYNGTFKIVDGTNRALNSQQIIHVFLELLKKGFDYENAKISHIKIFLKSGGSYMIGNLTEANSESTLHGLDFNFKAGRIVLNIRAELWHQIINDIVSDVLEVLRKHGFYLELVSAKHLTPSPPVPTYRLTTVIN